MDIELTTSFSTDVATFAIFDPSSLNCRINSDIDWWSRSPKEIKEVSDGKVCIVSTGCDGAYTLRLTSHDLKDTERNNAVGMIENMGAEVSSGKLYIGDGINIPGGGVNNSFKQSIDFPNGKYKLSIYAINQPDEGPAPDIVAIIKLLNPEQELDITKTKLEWTADNYLFAEKPKPKLGKKLSGKAWKTNRTESGLIIKDSEYRWPSSHDGYDVILTDMSDILRGDNVKFKTIDINENNNLIIGELISRTPKF